MKFASWSARSTAHSLSGARMRAATIARHARAVADTRAFGAGANGIPKRSRKSVHPTARSAVV